MPFDPKLSEKLHLMEGIDFMNLRKEDLARMDEFYRDPQPWTPPSDVDIADDTAPGPHGPVPVRIYRPTQGKSGRALVWVHGGGFASGDLDMLEAHMVSAELAARSGAVVFSVGYRVAANGVQYPVPLDDVQAAWHWVATGYPVAAGSENFTSVALGGASAGAALALATAQRLRDSGEATPAALLLAYPFLHYPNPALDPDVSAELAVLPSTLRFPPSNIEWMVRNYVGRLSNVPADAMPGNGSMGGLPDVRLVVSEYDDLRSSAELFERQLAEVGVPVKRHLAEGMPHGHLNRGPSLPAVTGSLDFFAQSL